MTRNNSFYQYNATTVLNNGLYKYDMSCKSGSLAGADSGYFLVSPTGDNRGFSLLFFIAATGGLIILFSILIKNEYFGFIGGTLVLVSGVYALIYGINNLGDLYTRSIGFTLVGLGAIFTIVAGYEIVDSIVNDTDDSSESDEGGED